MREISQLINQSIKEGGFLPDIMVIIALTLCDCMSYDRLRFTDSTAILAHEPDSIDSKHNIT